MKNYTIPELELKEIALSGDVCGASDIEDGTDFDA